MCCFKRKMKSWTRSLLFLVLLVILLAVLRHSMTPFANLFSERVKDTWTRSHPESVVNVGWTHKEIPLNEEPSGGQTHKATDSLQPTAELRFFNGYLVKSPQEILSSPWVAKLQELLRTVSISRQVAITFANFDYLESLLNWLLQAQVRLKPPVRNIIVACLDEKIFNALVERDIPVFYVNPETVARNFSALTNRGYRYAVWATRCVLYRLVNYFGYDVISYDTDAILLKNPQPLFDRYKDSDIISSAGSYPFRLSAEWGFTLCMGVIMFRSSSRTG